LGRDIYAIVSSYQTIDMLSAKLESHEKYIDIQIMLEGEERFYCINKSNLKPKTEYIKERDVKFYKKCFNTTSYFSDNILRPDSFILFYPEDAHMPKLKTNNVDKNVRKIVIKIKKELLNV
jgi:biofilm protein TabA